MSKAQLLIDEVQSSLYLGKVLKMAIFSLWFEGTNNRLRWQATTECRVFKKHSWSAPVSSSQATLQYFLVYRNCLGQVNTNRLCFAKLQNPKICCLLYRTTHIYLKVSKMYNFPKFKSITSEMKLYMNI